MIRYMGKLKQLREKLVAKSLDAMLITSSINRRYVTNFTGTAGIVVISHNDQFLLTDFRYVEQAEAQAKEFTIIEHPGPIELTLKNLLQQLQAKRIGFEANDITYAQYARFKELFDGKLIPVKGLIEDLRMIKSTDELNILKKAAHIADQAFEHIQSYIKPGVKEIDIANELEFFMRQKGATSSSFDIIVASGHRSALPHGVASNKEIQSGELVTMDYGALYKGYCSDITRTVAVGPISDELKNIYNIVLEAQKRGVEEIKPQMTGKEADAITRDYITEKGYGDYFGHSTGHGLGMAVHEEPRLSHQSDVVLKPGMVVTVEPGIYVPNLGGCRIEDDVFITSTGNERLTFSTKELIYL